MVSRVFRAKWYYALAGIVLPLLSFFVWAFYSAMLYYNTIYGGISPGLFDILSYGLVTFFCICFAIAGLLLGWLSKVTIIVGDDSIAYLRKKAFVKLKYSEVTGIRYAGLFRFAGIRLTSKKGSIRIFKDINGYDELYDILRQKVPAVALAEQEPLPEKIWATNEVPVDFAMAVVLVIVTISLMAVVLLAPSVSQAVFFAMLAIAMLAVVVMRLYRWHTRPYAFLFTPTEIRARKLFGEDEVSRLSIKEIRLGTTYRKTRYVKIPVKAVFIESLDGTMFVVEEAGSKYSSEQLYGMLRRTYGK